jgi:hypothetical protein
MRLTDTVLGKYLFWDAVVSELDTENHASYIIPRVMDYGTLEDVRFVMHLYGKSRIKDILLNAPSLQKITISFFAGYYNLSSRKFKAYKNLETTEWNR